jgi:hypothetical protein
MVQPKDNRLALELNDGLGLERPPGWIGRSGRTERRAVRGRCSDSPAIFCAGIRMAPAKKSDK